MNPGEILPPPVPPQRPPAGEILHLLKESFSPVHARRASKEKSQVLLDEGVPEKVKRAIRLGRTVNLARALGRPVRFGMEELAELAPDFVGQDGTIIDDEQVRELQRELTDDTGYPYTLMDTILRAQMAVDLRDVHETKRRLIWQMIYIDDREAMRMLESRRELREDLEETRNAVSASLQEKKLRLAGGLSAANEYLKSWVSVLKRPTHDENYEENHPRYPDENPRGDE